ncbi:MAG: hydroxyquinol 1,2-dioxygenase [bacterium]|nr:hydroxyquinol 1,2-dioxygenase [bacterium]
MASTTVFGSLADYQKGSIEIVSGDPRHYVFSNIFEVASKSKPYERVVVGKNLEYVQEVMRAEGISPWFACAHDEFALCMDGEVEIELVKLTAPPAAGRNGAVLIGDGPVGEGPAGKRMGLIRLRRGHQALLPAGCGYRFTARKTGVILQQTLQGELSREKWNEICLK